ncbi:sulfotransferase domain-containing protein [Candidatus Pelagibacter sp.]|nr:sulfotransferase domain-containing protein [Candidatus Pelagibacter sp.]MDA7770688.1 sulfotransferase domain-containing protein [Candidatus Pelagibacter sp.]
MIIWLASYPKSGNTWVRSIISSLLYSNDGIFNFELMLKVSQFPEKKYFNNFVRNFGNFKEIKESWIPAQDIINLDNQIKILKTHQGKYTVGKDSFTNNQNTLATIYIVRDPRTLISSISNHYTLNYNEALDFLMTPQIIGNTKKWEDNQTGMLCLLGKWNEHYRSWTRNKSNLLLIKYEDLIQNPDNELKKIIFFLKNYLNVETNINKNKKILETTSFKNLKKMEQKGLFRENVLNKEDDSEVSFFHLGPANNWKDNLNEDIKNKIEKEFHQEMDELGYL